MATKKSIDVRAGDTEPLVIDSTLSSEAEIQAADVNTVKFYARKDGAGTNHVDGVAMSSVTVSSTEQSDGTWDTTITATFDPASNKNGGGDAFDAEGLYQCYTLVTWSDGDETRHPALPKDLTVYVGKNFE